MQPHHSLHRRGIQPAACLLMALTQLMCAGRCAAQLLQAHGHDEAEVRVCNATANITTDCVTPHHGLLTGLVAFLSCLLFLMICSMALPLSAQNRILRLLSSCGDKTQRFNYIDVGLYKTRNAVCRREVWGNGQRGRRQSAGGTDADAAAAAATPLSPPPPPRPPPPLQLPLQPPLQPFQQPPQSPPPPLLPRLADDAAVCAVPIRIEPALEEEAASAAAAGGGCWTELQCQHPALVCDALFCYRSDPNIRQSAATRWHRAEETQRLLL